MDRYAAVSDRFDINIEAVCSADAWGLDCVPAIVAGDDAYDLLAPLGRNALEIALRGLVYDWARLPYIDVTQTRWDDEARESFTIHNRLYTMTVDLCYKALGGTFCLMFNKNLLNAYTIAYPYDDC